VPFTVLAALAVAGIHGMKKIWGMIIKAAKC
jgi:hypothetical protein